MKAFAALIPIVFAVLAAADPGDRDAGDVRLSQKDAEALLATSINGKVTLSSTGKCTDPKNARCTSLEGVRTGTLDALLSLVYTCATDVTITSGTEAGHAADTFSHANGYRLNLARSDKLDACIRRTTTPSATKINGKETLVNKFDDVYVNIGSNWEAVYNDWVLHA